jgi:hypothetical protein
MNYKNLTLSILGAIAMFILGLFNQEIKTLIINHWKMTLFIISAFVTALGIIGMYVEYNVKHTIKKSITSDIALMKTTFMDITRINHAIILANINDSQSKEETAKTLMSYYTSNGLTIPEWEKYSIHNDIIIELNKLYHAEELEKLNKVSVKG